MITVESGYCAVRVGRWWIGATARGLCQQRRRRMENALADAMRQSKEQSDE